MENKLLLISPNSACLRAHSIFQNWPARTGSRWSKWKAENGGAWASRVVRARAVLNNMADLVRNTPPTFFADIQRNNNLFFKNTKTNLLSCYCIFSPRNLAKNL